MSDYDAFLARLHADLQAESERGVSIRLSARSPLIPRPVQNVVVPPIETADLTFFGMPVVIDPDIPRDELHILDATGARRIIKIAE